MSDCRNGGRDAYEPSRRDPALIAQELHDNMLNAVLYLAQCVPGIGQRDFEAIIKIASGIDDESDS